MIPKFDSNYNSLMSRHFDSLGVLSDVIPDFDFRIFKKNLDWNEPEHDYMYWYHKDHLGSSTQITDRNETVIHHIEYMPSGEQFSEQRDNWATPYKFNGKELDSETNLYYYGARYYTPEIGIWLSVDPLSDKYPSLSPYNYCALNPVMLVDPDGRDNVIYLVNLQTDNKVNIGSLISESNKQFEKMGLNTRVKAAPDGKDFNPGYMDASDSYAVIGSIETIKSWVKTNDPGNDAFNSELSGWSDGSNNHEKSANQAGTKSNGIAIDANGLNSFANALNVSQSEAGALTIIHGAGHNANLNHSNNSFNARDGQNMENAAIMGDGNRIIYKTGFNKATNKQNNSVYTNTMKSNKYFGNNKSQNNYDSKKRISSQKTRHY